MSRAYRYMSSGTPDYSTNAAARGWGPGWPTDRTGSMSTFTLPTTMAGDPAGEHKWAQPGRQAFQVHYRVAVLLRLLLTEVQHLGYPLVAGWCWSYENRAISGTGTPSNHSWGLAADLNAPDNPYTSPRVTDMPAWMPALFAGYGWAWGGDYDGYTDSMHYEFMGTPDDATRATFAAGTALGLPVTPPPPPPPPLLGDDVLTVIESKEAGGHERLPAVLRPDGSKGHPVGPDMWTAVNHLAKAGGAKICNIPHADYDAFPLIPAN